MKVVRMAQAVEEAKETMGNWTGKKRRSARQWQQTGRVGGKNYMGAEHPKKSAAVLQFSPS